MRSEEIEDYPRYVDRRGTGSVKWDTLKERFGREDLVPLWVADGDFSAPRAVQEAIRKRAEHPVYGYAYYPEAFYEAIKTWQERRYGWRVEREWIEPAHWVVASLHLAIDACSEVGDGVIVQTPIYPPFLKAVKRLKRTLLENRLLLDGDRYRIDFEDLEEKAKEAKMLMLCSPHNPTSRAWSAEELERIVAIVEANDLIVVSDEIHADIVYGARHIPFATLPGMARRTLTFNAPSKTFNIPGLNTSYAIIPDDSLRRRFRMAVARSGLDNGNDFGIPALIAAYKEGGEWLGAMLKIYEENIVYVRDFLLEHTPKIRPLTVEATYLIWLDCREMELSDEELRSFFVEEARLALNSGVNFGKAGSGFMRINIATSQEVLAEAMKRLKEAYDQWERR